MEIQTLSLHEQAIETAQQDLLRLLRFAAGNPGVALPDELIDAAVAVTAALPKDFDVEKEGLLWRTLDRLARAVHPASIRSVRALEVLENSKSRPQPDQIIRRARSMSLWFLIILLVVQVYALVGSSIVKETQAIGAEIGEASKRRAEIEAMGSSPSQASAAALKEWTERVEQFGKRLDAENHMLALWVGISTSWFPWNWMGDDKIDNVSENFVNDQSAAVILDALALYLLPLLYGTLGASVYVLRRVAYQVDRSTFAPITWFGLTIRLSLGAVFGVTVGVLIVPQLRGSEATFLSAFALAFLAGYGVDAVFAVMDRWLYRLREEPKPAQGGQDSQPGGPQEAGKLSASAY